MSSSLASWDTTEGNSQEPPGNQECMQHIEELEKRTSVLKVQLFKLFKKPVEEDSVVKEGFQQKAEVIINNLEVIIKELENMQLYSLASMDLYHMEGYVKEGKTDHDPLDMKAKRENMFKLGQGSHGKIEFWNAFDREWQRSEVNLCIGCLVNTVTDEDWPQFMSELGINDSEIQSYEDIFEYQIKVNILEEWIKKGHQHTFSVRDKFSEALTKLGYHREAIKFKCHRYTAFF